MREGGRERERRGRGGGRESRERGNTGNPGPIVCFVNFLAIYMYQIFQAFFQAVDIIYEYSLPTLSHCGGMM